MEREEPIVRDFGVVMRGYDRTAVDRHLVAVARDLDRADARIAQLEAELDAAVGDGVGEPVLAPDSPARERFGALGEETTRILVVAEETARDMTERAARAADAEHVAAERAARERVDAATAHAERIVSEAERRRDAISAEMAQQRLEQERDLGRLAAVRDDLVSRLYAAVDVATHAAADLTDVVVEELPEHDGTAPILDEGEVTAAAVDEGGRPVGEESRPAYEGFGDPMPRDDGDGTADGHGLEGDVADEDAAAADGRGAGPDVAAADTDGDDGAAAAEIIVIDEVEQPSGEPTHDRGTTTVGVHAVVATDETAPRADASPPSARRDRSLAPVRSDVLRSVRRSLQDVQNGVLRDVRDQPTDADGEVLPRADALDSLVEAARAGVREAVRAGVVDGASMVGVTVTVTPDAATVDEAARAFADDMLGELRTTLSPSIRAGIDAEEPGASLSERVGEVFRDLKGPVVETLLDRHLIRTYGLATLSTWNELDVGRVAWVLAHESRCPEGRCRANAAEGPVPVGDEFPSGDVVPQVHDGCTCALAPAEA